MATNIRVYGASPRLPVDACVGAHGSGDLCFESGKFGIAVESNEVGQPNTLIERCNVVLPVPSGVVPGDKIYADDDYLGAPGGLAIGLNVLGSSSIVAGSTLQPAPVRSSFVPSVLLRNTGPSDDTYIGTAVTAAFFDGLTQVAVIELAPQ